MVRLKDDRERKRDAEGQFYWETDAFMALGVVFSRIPSCLMMASSSVESRTSAYTLVVLMLAWPRSLLTT